MTEIDFIPQWYRAGRKRRLWHHRQYLILGLVVALVAIWCFIAGRGLSHAMAELAAMRSDMESGIRKMQHYEQLQSRYSELQAKENLLDAILPRTPYTAVLAELSHCIGPDVVVKKLELRAEPIESADKAGYANGSAKTRPDGLTAAGDKSSADFVPAQTRVVISGYAADAKQVAELISAMEQSSYFFRVAPVYSKNSTADKRNITEFEIRCVLADFELSDEKK
jgi:hypothetical protein